MAILKNYIEGNLTQLNKLKYGDTATIGNEPIVQKTIPTNIRQDGPSSNQASRRIDDLKRIATILTQKPGLKYLANETALNVAKVTPKSDPSKTVAGNILSGIGANLFNSVKIIGSTLLQVPLNGTGTHFVKGFAGTGPGTYLYGKIDTAPHILARNGAPILADATWASTANLMPPGERENKDLQDEKSKGTKFLPGDGNGVPKVNNPKKWVKKENRLYLGDPTIVKRSISDSYAAGNLESTQDTLNKLSPYTGSFKAPSEGTRDIIKFRFNIITPEDNTYLHFRAYLDSLSDNFTGNWNSFNYVGRGENFHTYQGFDRQMSLSFKIAAQSRWEMRPLYQKIVTLASATAPTYKDGLMRGTFVKITVGDYVREMPGFITSVNYNWQQDYQWEIAMNNPEAQTGNDQADIDQQELPMVLDCQVNFTPIHTFTPQTGLYHYITTDIAPSPAKTLFFTKSENGNPGIQIGPIETPRSKPPYAAVTTKPGSLVTGPTASRIINLPLK